ncbi:MAG: PHP domain-containing protein [Asgard group archaeon]|nr:PHP domain-containing protein [Asgard group archaeon]
MKSTEQTNEWFVDLHLHTTASDGTYTPKEIVEIASNLELKAIAITDHDTVSGAANALDAATNFDIDVIPGIEFSTEINNESIHIVGLYVDYRNRELIKLTADILNARENRAKKIIELLDELLPDKQITFSEVSELADGLIGRPHIAEILIRKGVVQTINEAFDKYLRRNGPAYVPRFKLTPNEAVAFLHKIKAIPILAHPGYISSKETLDQLLQDLVPAGLKGIEVYYPTHSEQDIRRFKQIAQIHDLLESGGSDCHGERSNGPFIGSLNVPYSVYKKIKDYYNINKRWRS